MTPFDWDLPVAKPVLILGGLGLALIIGAGWQQRRFAVAVAEAKTEKEISRAALQREAQAKAQAAEDRRLAARWKGKADDLQRRLESLPSDPGPRPVDPSAPLLLVADGLRGLGIAPRIVGEDLGLSLPEGRTILGWGYEAQRVGPLAARLDTTTALARAQEGQLSALLSQVDASGRALDACDERAAAEQRRAEALDRALKAAGVPRNWSAGLLVGMDTEGHRHLGVFVGWSFKAVQVQAIAINNTAAMGAGIRF